jgi:hypothetical protein
MYIRSGRWLVTSIGMLSFVSAGAGMVLFIKASVAFTGLVRSSCSLRPT